MGKWKAGVQQRGDGRSVRSPKHLAAPEFSPYMSPQARGQAKGLFPEYTARSGPQDLRTFIIPHSDLSHFMSITLHGSPVVAYSASRLQMNLDDSGHDCGFKGGAHKAHRR